MLIDHQKLSITASSGSGAANTNSIRGIVRQIIVKPHTDSTSYNITLTNYMSVIVYERTSETGELAEINSIPVNGIYTVTISSATRDELFEVYLITQE